jgi:uncharacterized protein (UPF0548 family)
MFSFRRPSQVQVDAVLEAVSGKPFAYPSVGQTGDSETLQAGWTVDRSVIELGRGVDLFERARAAIQRWVMFQLGWVSIYPAPVAVGAEVAVLARVPGLWVLNTCRVVYVVDEPQRYGFAYGTLPTHVERGEERFLVRHDPLDDSVWFEILAVSRPNHWLAVLGYPYVRRLQRRFGRDALAAMTRAVAEPPAGS